MKRMILFLGLIHPDRNVFGKIDVEKLPVVDNFDYDEVVITGCTLVRNRYGIGHLCRGIRETFGLMGKNVKVLLHTYDSSWFYIGDIRSDIDGIVYSPRDGEELKYFREVNNKLMKEYNVRDLWKNYLIVNESIVDALPENTRYWQKESAESFVDATQDIRRVASFWSR